MLGHRLGVVRPRLGQPADDHVGVADGLDLLEAEPLGEPSKALKISSSTPTTRSGAVRSVNGVKSTDVGEQHGHVGVALGDDARSRA